MVLHRVFVLCLKTNHTQHLPPSRDALSMHAPKMVKDAALVHCFTLKPSVVLVWFFELELFTSANGADADREQNYK